MKTFFSLLLMVTSLCYPQFGNGQRPNLVFIILDDLPEKVLPPKGPSFLNYPSIQRIYQEGMYACNVYATMPLCNPCRYSILTGMYPHTHMACNNSLLPRQDLPTFFSILAGAGYHNAYVGKYANVGGLKNIPGIPKTFTIGKVDQYDPLMYYNNKQVSVHGVTAVIIDDTATSWLAKIDTPFALGIGNIGTHVPVSVVRAYQNAYNNMGSIPDNFCRFTKDYPSFFYTDTAKYCDPDDSTSGKNIKLKTEALYEILLEIDRAVGKIFTILQSRGILDNTMIIFTNDNGFLYGEHMLYSKGDASEESSGVPLFIRYPKWFKPGTQLCGTIIGLQDICPTILDAAGINVTKYHFEGKSIRSLSKQNKRTSLYFEEIHLYPDGPPEYIAPSWRAVRTIGYKYVRYHCDSLVEQLFDLKKDPEENTNRIKNPAYANTATLMRHLLDSLAITTNDTISIDTAYFPCTLIDAPQRSYGQQDYEGSEILVYPNPASSAVRIFIPGASTEGNIPVEVFDLFGREVFFKEVIPDDVELDLDVSQLASGMYYIHISLDGKIQTKVIEVQH